jgi:fatty-acyl-CoA synthase
MELEAMGIQLDQGYGLSEVWGPAVYRTPDAAWDALPALDRARLKTRQGIPNLVSDSVIVADPETLVPVPRDGATLGEVMFRGNMVMRGYLKDPAATAKAFAGGYFHSGDLAVCHPDGTIELRDRSKDLIISGGENISSIEVENAICEHEAVAGSAVIAVPDPKWGERPWAFVELKEGARDVSVDELLTFCRTRLAGFKIPKGASFGPLPRTPTGKVQKFLLRSRLEVES